MISPAGVVVCVSLTFFFWFTQPTCVKAKPLPIPFFCLRDPQRIYLK
jgi:hypothetical protein